MVRKVSKAFMLAMSSAVVFGALLVVGLSFWEERPISARLAKSESKMIAEACKEAVVTNALASAAGRVNEGKPFGRKAEKRATVVLRAAKEYSAADQKRLDAVQGALDDEDYQKVLKASQEAMKSDNPDVRTSAVDALGNFGERALVPLTQAMLDEDEDVAEGARRQVEMALMGMDNSSAAFDFAASYITSFNGDKESIGMFEGIMTSSANQIINPDDSDSFASVKQAHDNRERIVMTLVKMMESGGELEKAAQSAYKEISGDSWTSADNAKKWVEDLEWPENENE